MSEENLGREGLARLLGREVVATTRARFEFDTHHQCSCGFNHAVRDFNDTQVVRTWGPDKAAALREHRAAIESVLAYGQRYSVPTLRAGTTTFTGGRDWWLETFPEGQGVVRAFRGRELMWRPDRPEQGLGEPLLDPNIANHIAYIKKKDPNARTEFLASGTWLSDVGWRPTR